VGASGDRAIRGAYCRRVPFARIATIASVTLLVAVAGCSHGSTPKTVAAPAAAATDVHPESASEAPGVTEVPAPKATVPRKPVRKSSPPAAKADAGSGIAGVDRFVAAVQQKLPGVALDRRDEEVEDLGEQACEALKGGRSATVAAGEVAEQGVTASDARTLVGLAKNDLCRA
jgi:hypothetical protein